MAAAEEGEVVVAAEEGEAIWMVMRRVQRSCHPKRLNYSVM